VPPNPPKRDPAAASDWLVREHARPGAWRELQRLGRRARRRWLRTSLATIACVAALVAIVASRPFAWESRITLRVGGAPALTSNDALRRQVIGEVLSDARLLPVVYAYGLYPTLRARDPRLAVAALRAHLDVAVWRDGGTRHPAGLALTFHGDSAAQAYEVVRTLALFVVDERPLGATVVERASRDDEGLGRAQRLVLAGVVGLLAALPLCILAVGAFDRRIYDVEDVRRLGLRAVGAIRRFDGDNNGALVDRLRSGTRDRILRE
jgi:hypothetical protein